MKINFENQQEHPDACSDDLIDWDLIPDFDEADAAEFFEGESFRSRVDACDETLARLRDAPPASTLEEHMDRARQGLPDRNDQAVSVMRAMGALPLTRYIECLNPFSWEYAAVKFLQQDLPEDATYQQACNELYWMFMASGCDKKGQAVVEENEKCLAMFRAFARPFTQILSDLARESA